jgi:hydrogenase maturation factor
MLKSALLDAIRTEIRRHGLSHFQEDKVVVPGCPFCRMSEETIDLVCQVCHSVIATLFKEGFAASA